MTTRGALLLLLLSHVATATETPPLSVAVASNFHDTARDVAAAFTAATGVRVEFSSGSTGKLYAQIVNGAPYDLFLAADVVRPRRLVDEGRAVEGSLTVYAIGRVVLWSAAPALAGQDCLRALRDGDYRYVALPNPATAPYGAVALQLLEDAGIPAPPATRIARAENVAQAWQFVAAQNATLGFAAAAQVAARPDVAATCLWAAAGDANAVPQAGVVLSDSRHAAAARFLAYFAGDDAKALLAAHGYESGAAP